MRTAPAQQMNMHAHSYAHDHPTHAQFEAKWTQLVTLARQLERSAQISLANLITIGLEVQATLDQCERLASKSPQLEGEHEVVADLVIGYDLAMAQNQPKLTADWFAHRMGTTHTPAAAASKKRAMQELKDQRALGGKEAYQSVATWQQTAPTSPWYSPTHQPSWGGGPAYSPPPHTGWGRRTHIPPPLPPASNPGTTHHPLEAAELAGAEPGEGGGVLLEEGAVAVAAAAARCVHYALTRASQPATLLQRALSPRATSAVSSDTSNATAPTKIDRQTTTAVPGG